jgi:hypothetical protein
MLHRTQLGSALALLAIGCLGCGSTAPPVAPAPDKAAKGEHDAHDEHDHGEAPHGGTYVEWGGGAYHAEFTVDRDKQTVTVYILGGDGKSPLPINAESVHLSINEPMTEIDLTPQPLEGEAEGSSSRFVGTHETFGLDREFAGTVSGQIDGTPYTGDFKEASHEGHKK